MSLRSPGLFLFLALSFLAVALPAGSVLAEEVAVGVILPLSGTHAAIGHMQKNSMVMAIDEINSRGGIDGQLLKLDIRDSGGQPGNARAVIDHFVNDKQYAVVLGGFSSRVAAALADKCEQKRIPLVVVTGSEDDITLQDYKYVFRVSPPRSKYPAAALDFIKSIFESARIVLITERSLYGDSMARTVKQAARDARWGLVGEWRFDLGSRNLETLLAEALKTMPEVIFLTAFPPEAARIIEELHEILPRAVVVNLTPVSTVAGSYAQCGAACNGVMNPSLWLPNAFKSGSRYKDRYLTRFESEPDYHGAQAYAAVLVAAQAIRRAGVAQPEPVREALAGVAVNTPYGRVNFREWGGFVNQNDPANYLVQWTDTTFEVIWPRGSQTAVPVLPE